MSVFRRGDLHRPLRSIRDPFLVPRHPPDGPWVNYPKKLMRCRRADIPCERLGLPHEADIPEGEDGLKSRPSANTQTRLIKPFYRPGSVVFARDWVAKPLNISICKGYEREQSFWQWPIDVLLELFTNSRHDPPVAFLVQLNGIDGGIEIVAGATPGAASGRPHRLQQF